ncbi:MAG: Fur family transcriptional regulator [Nocardioidaceae bacterium]
MTNTEPVPRRPTPGSSPRRPAPGRPGPGLPAGTRPTRQRRAVASALAACEEFRSAQEIYDVLRHDGETVGLSTVYRTLQALADAGEVDVLRAEDGEASYRRCSTSHHHHLVCRECGHTVEIEGPTVERWAEKVAAEHGFSDLGHSVEIFGTCRACSPTSVRPSGHR